jgi:hypothetical protein
VRTWSLKVTMAVGFFCTNNPKGSPVFLPLILLIAATLLAAVVAYGNESSIGSIGHHGLDLILWSRRLEWPLAVAAILLCVVVVALVVSAKRRAWWLLGLLPVLALFSHRFITGPSTHFHAIDDPVMVAGERAGFLAPSDEIVGISRDGVDYAFPFSVLFHDPVVVLSDRAGGLVLLWSPLANRAMAFTAARDLHARDLDIVSQPCDALFVLNTRLGQFINGVTGKTPDGNNPTGFLQPLTATKVTWADWLSRHPKTTQVMFPPNNDWKTSPNQPIAPVYSGPGEHGTLPNHRSVCLVASTQPIAVPSEMVTDQPLNLVSGQTSILLVRLGGVVRAFNRQLPLDLVPRFKPTTDPKHKSVAWVDSDTGSEWSIGGEALEGPKEMLRVRLEPLPVEDDVYLGVMRIWFPTLHEATPAELAQAVVIDKPPIPASNKPLKKKRQRKK